MQLDIGIGDAVHPDAVWSDFEELVGAIPATFHARKTAVPKDIEGLGDEFKRTHMAMWEGFLRREPSLAKVDLAVVMECLRVFLQTCLLPDAASQFPSPRTWDPTLGAWSTQPYRSLWWRMRRSTSSAR